MTKPRAKKTDDAALKAAVLEAALALAPQEGFSDAMLARACDEAGVDGAARAGLFPSGPPDLVEAFSESIDAEMEKRLMKAKLSAMKIRERIKAAVMARLDALRPHKDAARRAAAFLTLPPHAGLGATLLYRSVDRMWRAVGDTSTDFNFYTKRAILAGVYSATLLRWFTDDSEDEKATREFLDARIENVMQFEKLKAQVKERAKGLPSLGDILGAVSRRRS
ncbi:MAG TPA: COQ9 family protein [Rhizomicrobium sp.]|nr:COQ9 family protein [Rhizomicrobium sp.]